MLLQKPALGSCWVLGVTDSGPSEVWALTKHTGVRGPGNQNRVEANLGMKTVSTIN